METAEGGRVWTSIVTEEVSKVAETLKEEAKAGRLPKELSNLPYRNRS